MVYDIMISFTTTTYDIRFDIFQDVERVLSGSPKPDKTLQSLSLTRYQIFIHFMIL